MRHPQPPGRIPAHCAGFTLVELAVCIAVIGLLAAGIMQGTALLESARSKAVVALAKDIKQSSHSFKARYHYWPGDLPNAASTIPSLASACSYPVSSTVGDGRIDEHSCAVDHLVVAGFMKGQPDNATPGRYRPFETAYGQARLISASASGVAGIPNAIQNVIVFLNLPCDVALHVDEAFDDGDLGSGRARGSLATCISGGANDPLPLLAIPL